MRTDLWDNRIEIVSDGGDHFKNICTPRDALACLSNDWPEPHSKSYAVAKRACVKAIEGKVPLSVAEAAFMKAADEAGILRQ